MRSSCRLMLAIFTTAERMVLDWLVFWCGPLCSGLLTPMHPTRAIPAASVQLGSPTQLCTSCSFTHTTLLPDVCQLRNAEPP